MQRFEYKFLFYSGKPVGDFLFFFPSFFILLLISVFSKLPVKDAKTNCKSNRGISCPDCSRVNIDAH